MTIELKEVIVSKQGFITHLTINLLHEIHDVLDEGGKIEDKISRLRKSSGIIKKEIAELNLLNKQLEENRWKIQKQQQTIQKLQQNN